MNLTNLASVLVLFLLSGTFVVAQSNYLSDSTVCEISNGNSTMKDSAINEARRRGLACQFPNLEANSSKQNILPIKAGKGRPSFLVFEGGKSIRIDYPECSDAANHPSNFDPICTGIIPFSTDGTEYIGGYQNANFNGYGILYKNYQIYQSGMWSNGKLIRSLPIEMSVAEDKKPDLLKTPPVNRKLQPNHNSEKKCLRMGLVPGSDDYSLCIKSSGG